MNAFRTALMTAVAALLSTAALADEAGEQSHLRVTYDQSKLLRLDRPVKTIIVGNPTIADVQLVNERTIYVLGRMFGNTNIIAVDAEGGEVANTLVTVGGADTLQVTVWRGPNGQRTLACAPECERTITQGDSEMTQIHGDGDKKIEISEKSAALAK